MALELIRASMRPGVKVSGSANKAQARLKVSQVGRLQEHGIQVNLTESEGSEVLCVCVHARCLALMSSGIVYRMQSCVLSSCCCCCCHVRVYGYGGCTMTLVIQELHLLTGPVCVCVTSFARRSSSSTTTCFSRVYLLSQASSAAVLYYACLRCCCELCGQRTDERERVCTRAIIAIIAAADWSGRVEELSRNMGMVRASTESFAGLVALWWCSSVSSLQVVLSCAKRVESVE